VLLFLAKVCCCLSKELVVSSPLSKLTIIFRCLILEGKASKIILFIFINIIILQFMLISWPANENFFETFDEFNFSSDPKDEEGGVS
jgi:hypothetical protein